MFPHMTDRQVDYVCESLAEALRAAAVGSETASAQ
jgi:phage terminase Nu1 subunit (DNA packaging protein)